MTKEEKLRKYTIPQLKAIIKRSKVKGITGKNKSGLIKMIIDNNIKYEDEKMVIDKIAKILPKKPRANNVKSAQAQAKEALALMKEALGEEARGKARNDDRFMFRRQRKKPVIPKSLKADPKMTPQKMLKTRKDRQLSNLASAGLMTYV